MGQGQGTTGCLTNALDGNGMGHSNGAKGRSGLKTTWELSDSPIHSMAWASLGKCLRKQECSS
eukprot:1276655-Karenia_brevis.AAC.1